MSRQPADARYPAEIPEGFSLLREYDPELGLNFFRVKFTATLEQALTDELLARLSIPEDDVWDTVMREINSNLRRRFG